MDTTSLSVATPTQLQLFDAVVKTYAAAPYGLANDAMYEEIASRAGIPLSTLNAKQPIGESGQQHSPVKRTLRWMQQNLRRVGMLERLPQRGRWQLTEKAKAALTKAQPEMTMIGFSTTLGLALWTENNDALCSLDEPVHLLLTSPPYLIADGRAYGVYHDEKHYIDFICGAIEPIVAKLARGASVVLNLGNDCFVRGLPARSMYRERLMLALHDRFGLYKMDELIWLNPTRPPGPLLWASIKRVQLNQSYEPILWLTNDPMAALSNNRRVLQPHTEQHKKLLAKGGESRQRSNADGKHKVRVGSYGNATEGRIPRNVLSYTHNCPDQRAYKTAARALNLPVHGAAMPLALAKFLVEFLTEPGQLVVDRFAGSQTTAKACELTGRRWLTCENALEYVYGGSTRFETSPGFTLG
jgi:site-specific DNA-methyltransferase (cytosine-N4-specific)